jgi:hypothetical protein
MGGVVMTVITPELLEEQARQWGRDVAAAELAAGFDGPRESPLGGEWADDLSPVDVYRRLLGGDGFAYDFVDADTRLPLDTEATLDSLLTAWEDGYYTHWHHYTEGDTP